MAQDSRAKRYHNALELGFILAVVMVGTSSARAGAAAPVVSGRTVLETDAAHPGSTVKAAVVAEIAPGYHINDHVPSLDYLIPTEVKLDAAKPVSVSRAVYPKGVPRKFAFLDTPISVYEGKLSIGVLLKVEAGAAPGIYTLTGSLRYQACNERACLPPATVPLTLVVRVAPPGASLRRLNSDVFTRIKFN